MQVGDIVTIKGMQTSEFANDSSLLKVSHAKNGQTVIGVVQGYAEVIIKNENDACNLHF